MTDYQREVMLYIQKHPNASVTDIARALDKKAGGIHAALTSLKKRGYIKWLHYMPRSFEILKKVS